MHDGIAPVILRDDGIHAAKRHVLVIYRDHAHHLSCLDRLTSETPEKLWQSNIFGKSVYDLIQEGITGKLVQTPEDVRAKFRGSLTRIVNEGASGLICLIL